jgi:hypothetical protein
MGQYEHVRQSLQLNHLSMKEGSLFCFAMRSTNQDASDCVLGVFRKALDEEGCMGLVT